MSEQSDKLRVMLKVLRLGLCGVIAGLEDESLSLEAERECGELLGQVGTELQNHAAVREREKVRKLA